MVADQIFEKALADAREGRLDQAEKRCREILEENPSYVKANLMLGIALARSGRENEASTRLKVVLEQEPQNPEALKWIAGVLNRLGRFSESIEYAENAVAARPEDYEARLGLAQAMVGVGRVEDAVQAYLRAIREDPKRRSGYAGLYHLLIALGRMLEARNVLAEGAKQVGWPWFALRLSQLSLQFGSPQEAIGWAVQVPGGSREEEDALVALAAAYGYLDQFDREDEVFKRIEALNPNNHFVPMLRGFRLQGSGSFEDAEKEFRRSISLEAKVGESYYGIVAGRKMLSGDAQFVEDMETILETQKLMPDESGPLYFALGKAYDDLGRYGDAMGQFIAGNRMIKGCRMGSRMFDRKALELDVERTIDLFSKEFFAEHRGKVNFTPKPILIIGAMRSGTTLLEQVLSMHPAVGTAGEQTFWRRSVGECLTYDPFDPESGVHHKIIRIKAKEYVELLRSVAPGDDFITDKEPGNHRYLGIIHLALPNSPLIQMKRHLADIAISMFTTYFRTAEEYVWDRDDIVFALRQHVRLANHWKSVISADQFLEVEYDQLVTEPEPVVQRILEFCGLSWEENCLHPERNPRNINTPSFWQVRQPLNPNSVDRWRRYEGHLGPLQELVDEVQA